jgi:hypothetical protein
MLIELICFLIRNVISVQEISYERDFEDKNVRTKAIDPLETVVKVLALENGFHLSIADNRQKDFTGLREFLSFQKPNE